MRPPASLLDRLSAAFAFYTCLPVPTAKTLDFRGIARAAPVVGVAIGLGMGAVDAGLGAVGIPSLPRSAIVVWIGVLITGGLHLDGAMDTADGLAVPDRKRRLTVMADSAVGAFGAMAAIAILSLKITALAEITELRWLVLAGIAAWGRWAQLLAILCYPYLKPDGKGRFHKDSIRSPQDLFPSLLLVVSLSGLYGVLRPESWLAAAGLGLCGGAIAILTGAWFNRQLGGHTGDTYGAVVEWTETLLLLAMVVLQARTPL
jgi:adenosylcobinamide-GDP ribazoletransferase